jgi:GGDEF domain-containing protein
LPAEYEGVEEERRLMGPVSGLLWLAGAGVAVVGWLLPGSPHDHAALFWGLVAVTVVYALACVTRLIPWERVSLGGHALAVVTLQPLVAASLWLTGGADAYMGPVLVLPMLYVAYFFPARYAWPLAALEVLTYASPLLTSDGSNHLLVARAFSYAVAYAGLVLTIQFLKRRLVAAERHQHRMARVDPLTGLDNRRAFDAHASEAVRGGDCLARIGGDEIALVAPGAGSDAAHRLANSLRDAVARVEAGGEPVSITVSSAVYPEDGTDRFTLMRSLDRELHAGKDARRNLNVA